MTKNRHVGFTCVSTLLYISKKSLAKTKKKQIHIQTRALRQQLTEWCPEFGLLFRIFPEALGEDRKSIMSYLHVYGNENTNFHLVNSKLCQTNQSYLAARAWSVFVFPESSFFVTPIIFTHSSFSHTSQIFTHPSLIFCALSALLRNQMALVVNPIL